MRHGRKPRTGDIIRGAERQAEARPHAGSTQPSRRRRLGESLLAQAGLQAQKRSRTLPRRYSLTGTGQSAFGEWASPRRVILSRHVPANVSSSDVAHNLDADQTPTK